MSVQRGQLQYDKLKRNYKSMVAMACGYLWLLMCKLTDPKIKCKFDLWDHKAKHFLPHSVVRRKLVDYVAVELKSSNHLSDSVVELILPNQVIHSINFLLPIDLNVARLVRSTRHQYFFSLD